MNALWNDLRTAARALARRPGMVSVAVLTLALGIGASTTVFSWIRAFLLEPVVGIADPGRVVEVAPLVPGQDFSSVSYPDYESFRDRARSFSGMTVHTFSAVGLAGENGAERAWAEVVSASFFDVLGVRPAAGRFLLREEDRVEHGAPVVVISHGLWQRRFGGSPAAIGRTLDVNGHAFTVVGVAPPSFQGGYSGLAFDLWAPIAMHAQVTSFRLDLDERGSRSLNILARLAPGVSVAQARAEVGSIAADLARSFPDSNSTYGATVNRLGDSANGPQRTMAPVLAILLGQVVAVLLIACANVANLLLARATERRHEMAVRLALGAGRGVLIRLHLLETLLISLLAGIAAVAVATVGRGMLGSITPPLDLPTSLSAPIDWRVLAFALAAAVISALVAGLAPARLAARTQLALVVREEARSTTGTRRRGWLRDGLVVAQVAMSLLLLVCAALFVTSHARATRHDPGFEPDGMLLAGIHLFSGQYTAEQGSALYEQLQARLSALPGVQSASLARRVPLGFGGSSSSKLEVEGYEPTPDERMWTFINEVGPGYFATMRQPLLAGRELGPQDRRGAPPVVVVSQALAEKYCGGIACVGRRVRWVGDWRTVVGVVRNIDNRRLGESPAVFAYVPLLQVFRPEVNLHLRTSGDPAALAPAVRRVVAELAPTLPVFNLRTMRSNISAASFQQRTSALVLAVMGGMALLIAVVGLYAVLAFAIERRTHEIGIRLALGASGGGVARLVLAHALKVVGIGLGIGMVLSLVVSRLMAGILFGVSPAHPPSYLAGTLVLVAVAALACLAPARRAARLDPMAVLRAE